MNAETKELLAEFLAKYTHQIALGQQTDFVVELAELMGAMTVEAIDNFADRVKGTFLRS